MAKYYPAMGSKEYWLQREKENDKKLKKSEDKILKEIENVYKQAFTDSKKELQAWYSKYAKDGKLSYNDAQRLLSPIDADEYRRTVLSLKYVTPVTKEIQEQIEILNARREVTRLMELIDSIDVILSKASHNIQIKLEDHLVGIFKRQYQDALSSLGAIRRAIINEEAIKFIIRYPYTGSMFSSRIWRNKNILLGWIKDSLTTHLIRGSSVPRMTRDLMSKTDTKRYQAERLVRTETINASVQGQIRAYAKEGVTHFEIIAASDKRTCPECEIWDGSTVHIRDAVPGDTIPPKHPNCRCSIMPLVTDDIDDSPTKGKGSEKPPGPDVDVEE